METYVQNTTAADNLKETLTSTPRFDLETEAAARPVVPLSQTRGTWGTIRRVRNTRPRSVVLVLAIMFVVGLASALIYRTTSTSVPSTTPPTVSESIIKAAPEPASLSTSKQPLSEKASIALAPQRQRTSEESLPIVREEPIRQNSKEEERFYRDEEKSAERLRKEEQKLLKRQRKEADRLIKHERQSEKSDEPKPRLVGVYTMKRKH